MNQLFIAHDLLWWEVSCYFGCAFGRWAIDREHQWRFDSSDATKMYCMM